MAEEMHIAYSESAFPLRTLPCLAWLIEYGRPDVEGNRRDILLTSVEMTTEEVVEIVRHHSEDSYFVVSNITVGAYMLLSEKAQRFRGVARGNDHFYDTYRHDARKVDSNLEVQL